MSLRVASIRNGRTVTRGSGTTAYVSTYDHPIGLTEFVTESTIENAAIYGGRTHAVETSSGVGTVEYEHSGGRIVRQTLSIGSAEVASAEWRYGC